MLLMVKVVNNSKEKFFPLFTSLSHLHLSSYLIADEVNSDFEYWECCSTVYDSQHIEQQMNGDLVTIIVVIERHLIVRTDSRDNRLVTVAASNLLTNICFHNTLDSNINLNVGKQAVLIFPTLIVIKELGRTLIEIIDFLRIFLSRIKNHLACFFNSFIVLPLALQIFENLMSKWSIFDIGIVAVYCDINDLTFLIVRNITFSRMGQRVILEFAEKLLFRKGTLCSDFTSRELANIRERFILLTFAIKVQKEVIVVDTDRDRIDLNGLKPFMKTLRNDTSIFVRVRFRSIHNWYVDTIPIVH